MKLLPIYLLLLIGISSVFYFSWLPDPQLGKYENLPTWLTHWTDTDANMNTRTAVPFIFIGLLSGSCLIVTKQRWHWWFVTWIGLILIVLSAELGQFTLPKRHFDWGDVVWGSSGSIAGLILAILLRPLLKRLLSIWMQR